MVQKLLNSYLRRKFGKTKPIIDLPDLLEIQKKPYEEFLQKDIPHDQRNNTGLQALFKSIYPIISYCKHYAIDFDHHEFDQPPYGISECMVNDRIYSLPLRMLLRLRKEGNKIDHGWVNCGEIPLMTDNGSFIINGSKKVVISQFVRSKGVSFTYNGKLGEKAIYSATIDPKVGPRIMIELLTNTLRCTIPSNKSKKKEFSIVSLLRATGGSNDEIEALLSNDNSLKNVKPELVNQPIRKESKDNLYRLFSNPNKYSLGKEGRFNINQKLGVHSEGLTITKEDILEIVNYLINLKDGKVKDDDIDHLGNKRLEIPAELIEDHLSLALRRIADLIKKELNKQIKESSKDKNLITFKDLLNEDVIKKIQWVQNTINSFFTSNKLCQFLEDYNPLSDLTHKRRLSMTGSDILKKAIKGNEIKQLHPSHYGRICPVETPERNTTGLITSLSTYARANENGFVVTPYRKVDQGKAINKEDHLTAFEDEKHSIAHSTEPFRTDGLLINKNIVAHLRGYLVKAPREKVNYIDISPSQILSVSAALIPFIENNDPTRALMATNMQRQAVPLLKPEAPLVGTGMEEIVARDSGVLVIAKKDGFVKCADANKITIATSEEKIHESDTCFLIKNQRTNRNTCINQRPLVKTGDNVEKGDIIAEGYAVDKGELALGRNLLVAFVPWRGYNFEDAIIINENIVKKDFFTSLQIQEYSASVRRFIQEDESAIKGVAEEKTTIDWKAMKKDKTKQKMEILTRDIPFVSEYEKRHLKENGLVKIGSRVGPGDILVGKIEVRLGEKTFSPEEKLLRASLGIVETFDDTSLRVLPGVEGTVTNIRIIDKDLPKHLDKIIIVTIATKRKLSVGDKMAGRHGNKGVISKIVAEEDMPFLKDGTPVDIILNPLGVITRMNLGQILETHLGWAGKRLGDKIKELIDINYNIKELKKLLKDIYSNGEVSKYVDKASDDDILSLAKRLQNGVPMESPCFDGATEEEIEKLLKLAGLPLDGKTELYDGITGEPFVEKATVGIIYMMKLHHMVKNKMHARSVGSYVSITQQPKKGKAEFGGQRLGEMEARALYGYGAANTLKESMTIKSDDAKGRDEYFEKIIQGEAFIEPHFNESFKVLVKELQGLCFNLSYTTKIRGDNAKWTRLDKKLSLSPDKLNALKISLASSKIIEGWSHGEVKEWKIMDYRGGGKFIEDGLFCKRIFGPTEDYHCGCPKKERKYKGQIIYKGQICDECKVEVTEAEVRRERMGYIKLSAPVTHIWFLPTIKDLMKIYFNIKEKDVERIIYYASYIVLDPGNSVFKKFQFLNIDEYKNAIKKSGKKFKAGIGAEAIRELLKETNAGEKYEDLKKEYDELKKQIDKEPEKKGLVKRSEDIIKKLEIIKPLVNSDTKPEWMVLEVLPVIPPELRPHISRDSGVTIISDFNLLYQRVIRASNAVENDSNDPEILVKKKRIQWAVDELFSNGQKGTVTLGTVKTGRVLKSFTDQIKGKEGRFRRDLLGKTLDYSGRSVIVSGPELKLHQCGLPKGMAIELFKPFIIGKLIKDKIATSHDAANRMIKEKTDETWNALDEIIKGYPVLLNRQPTLHRMNIQAFEPILVEEEAIKLHPMVCTSFAADFDGDTMAVHVPLLPEALKEAKNLLMSTNNIISPATGKPIIKPSQDMILGIHYMTKEKSPANGEVKIFSNPTETIIAFNNSKKELHSKIMVRIEENIVETTPGRILFKEIIPPDIPLKFDNSKDNGNYNREIKSKDLSDLISLCHKHCGQQETVLFCERLKELGFEQATRSGISIGIRDAVIPEKKEELIIRGYSKVSEIEDKFNKGHITEEKKKEDIVNTWENIERKVKTMLEALDNCNPLSMMICSGARGNIHQLMEMAGMKGIINNSYGETLDQPITSNYRDGQNAIEYFTSSYQTRKALINQSKATQDAGDLARRLMYAALNSIVTERDCRTTEGITINILNKDEKWIRDNIIGRIALENIKDHDNVKVICQKNNEIGEEIAENIQNIKIKEIKVRSPLTCKTNEGVCSFCYGRDLSRRKIIDIGEAVGVIASQSISEPITQFSIGAHKKGKKVMDSGLSQIKRLLKVSSMEETIMLIKDTLKTKGMDGIIDAAQLLIDNIIEIFMAQDININKRHFEVIVREMLKYVTVIDCGETDHHSGEIIERRVLEEENQKLGNDKTQATFKPALIEIAKIPTYSDSFLSDTSFEDTPGKLAKAAIEGKIDYLKGIQENVMLGRLIPVGTGHPKYTA